jgi:Sigma-70, region 4
MSRLQQLPSDQSAVLSLLLRQRKTYAQVAGMLGIRESAVQNRAYEAILALGADEGTSLLRTHRQEIGDYLLGQRDSLSRSTRTYLRTLPNGQIWANEVRAQLQEISSEELPPIPSDEPVPAAAPEYAPTRLTPQPEIAEPGIVEHREDHFARLSAGSTTGPVSRRAGALLLAGILVVIIVAVILISGGGGGHSHASKSTAKTETSTSQTSTNSSSGVHVDAQFNLTATQPGSSATGAVEVASEGSKRAFDVIAEGLAPTSGFFYVAWLYNSPSHAEPLGKAPTVSANGKLQAAGPLPANAGEYHEMILTKETDEHATRPGQIVLKGTFDLHSSGSSTSGSGSSGGDSGEASGKSGG